MWLFTGRDELRDSIVHQATLMLLKLAKKAVHDLFQRHREEVTRSWDAMLDQEETVGYLV